MKESNVDEVNMYINPNLLLEESPDALIVTNENGKILYANAQVEKTFGYQRHELIGKIIECLVSQSFRFQHQQHRKNYLKHPEKRPMGLGLNLVGLHKDGHEIPLDISLSPIQTNKGLFILAAIRDITDRRQLEEKIQQKNRELFEAETQNWRLHEANLIKNELLENMSVELRNPLNGIIGLTNILREERLNLTPEQKEYLNGIVTSANYLSDIINEILSLTEIESGNIKIHRQKSNVAALVTEVTTHLDELAKNKKIKITIDISPDISMANVDQDYFKQILFHYLSNAIKYTHDEGNVEIRIKPEDEHSIRIEVEDTGIGIKEEELGKLFMKFQQLDHGERKKYPGVGAGLAIVKRIVEAQHGKIGVNSNPGKGSTFFAVLPLNNHV